MDPELLLRSGLERAGIAPAATYSTGQVAKILGVSAETVRRLVDAYEPPDVGPDHSGPGPVRHCSSGMRALRITTHRRIPHEALLTWLAENAAYLRMYGSEDA